MTWSEMIDVMRTVNRIGDENKRCALGAVVFTQDSFTKKYSEKERTYYFSNSNRLFQKNKCSNSVWGDCADGVDEGVRLDLYIHGVWKIERCYIVTDTAVLEEYGIE